VETTTTVVDLLVSELGDKVSRDTDVLEEVRADKSGHVSSGPPLCVVYATSTNDVSRVLALAHETRTPVVTRGGGSGLAGGAIGSPGEIVLSVERMNRIIEISVDDRWAVVEAGVINDHLNEAAKKQGLWFAPDPASRPWATIGGNIATNAGGLLCMKYGVTREAVLDLTVVLAGGDVITVGHKTVKGVTGFDLAALFVGSEGTLGVITQATVALKPVDPHPVWTISGYSSNLDDVTRAVADTISQKARPALMELMDERAVAHTSALLGRSDLPTGASFLATTLGSAPD